MMYEQKPSSRWITYLPVSTSFHHGHNDILCRHKWKFLPDVTFNDFRIHNNALTNVLQCQKDTVSGQECLSQCYSPREPHQASYKFYILVPLNLSRSVHCYSHCTIWDTSTPINTVQYETQAHLSSQIHFCFTGIGITKNQLLIYKNNTPPHIIVSKRVTTITNSTILFTYLPAVHW